ncbi:hypothetical protein [Citrobacter phage Tr1]|nr:hypothetical protein [Citrobacter phage Tr1]
MTKSLSKLLRHLNNDPSSQYTKLLATKKSLTRERISGVTPPKQSVVG